MQTPLFKLLLLGLAVSLALQACNVDEICERGKGTRITQEIALPPFSGIDLEISGDVYLTQGPVQYVEVIGQENIISFLNLDINNQGVWEIRFTECVRKTASFDIHITLPSLDYVALSGSGNIEGQNTFDTGDLQVRLPGSGNISLQVNGGNVICSLPGSGNIALQLNGDVLESEIAGSGDLAYTGEVNTHKARISGSGDIDAFELITDWTDISIAGSGNADVFANDKLDILISGSGNVSYKGSPAINATITGSGRVINAN